MASSDNSPPRLETPVAFIIFNRPESTTRVFRAIAKAKPTTLLVISDGPRQSRLGEEKLVAECREIALAVDWECEVFTNFSDNNMGCRDRVSTGLDWVFSKVNEAIILEDDCLPSESFFRFASEMLERYRFNDKVGAVSGSNVAGYDYPKDVSYLFSKFPLIWGWATWARTWKSYDVAISFWPKINSRSLLKSHLTTAGGRRYWKRVLEGVHKGQIDTWDYQLSLAHWMNGYLSIVPTVNLVSNIGFGSEATHTINPDSVYSNTPRGEMELPARHPATLEADLLHDLALEVGKFQEGRFRGTALRFFGVMPNFVKGWIVALFSKLVNR